MYGVLTNDLKGFMPSESDTMLLYQFCRQHSYVCPHKTDDHLCQLPWVRVRSSAQICTGLVMMRGCVQCHP